MQHLVTAQRTDRIDEQFVSVSDRHRLVVVNNGQFLLRAQHHQPVKAGSIALLPAGQTFAVSHLQSGDIRVLYFCGNCLGLEQSHELIAPFRLARFSQHKVMQIGLSKRRWLNGLFDRIELEQEAVYSSAYEILRSLLLLALHEVRLLYPVNDTRPRSKKVELALQFIEAHYSQPISLDVVASHVHWSAPYLANKMKSETGRSVGEWLKTFRHAEARVLLVQSDANIGVVAQEVGYRDVNHFTRDFRRLSGITPAAWRRQYFLGTGQTFSHSLSEKRRKGVSSPSSPV